MPKPHLLGSDSAANGPTQLTCPECKDHSRIDIAALVWVRQTTDGTDADAADDQSHDWDGASPCICRSCGHSGTVTQFQEKF